MFARARSLSLCLAFAACASGCKPYLTNANKQLWAPIRQDRFVRIDRVDGAWRHRGKFIIAVTGHFEEFDDANGAPVATNETRWFSFTVPAPVVVRESQDPSTPPRVRYSRKTVKESTDDMRPGTPAIPLKSGWKPMRVAAFEGGQSRDQAERTMLGTARNMGPTVFLPSDEARNSTFKVSEDLIHVAFVGNSTGTVQIIDVRVFSPHRMVPSPPQRTSWRCPRRRPRWT
jgi:hypothetical protein